MSETNPTPATLEKTAMGAPGRRPGFVAKAKKRRLNPLILTLILVGVLLGVVVTFNGLPPKESLKGVIVYIIAAFVIFSLIFHPIFDALLSGRRATDEQRTTAEVLEAKAEKEETLVDYVEAQLIAAAARQEVAVRTAERRANGLSSVGIILMVSSVLVPFVLVYLYMSLPPTAPANSAGVVPQRDWHLLLAGVSFGLLFIAAARGILLAEGRQREVYAREVRETAYYGDLRRALGMAQRLDREDQDATNKATRDIVQKIMALMLERGGRETAASLPTDTPPASEHEFLKILADAVKK